MLLYDDDALDVYVAHDIVVLLPNLLLSTPFVAGFSCVIEFQKRLNSMETPQYRAPIFRVVKIQIKSVKKDVVPIIILSWGT